MTNKEKAILLAKVAGLFLWGIVAVWTSSAVWSSKPDVATAIVAGLNLVINGVAIFFASKKIKNI